MDRCLCLRFLLRRVDTNSRGFEPATIVAGPAATQDNFNLTLLEATVKFCEWVGRYAKYFSCQTQLLLRLRLWSRQNYCQLWQNYNIFDYILDKHVLSQTLFLVPESNYPPNLLT